MSGFTGKWTEIMYEIQVCSLNKTRLDCMIYVISATNSTCMYV